MPRKTHNKPKKPRRPVPLSALEEHLKEQVEFLERSTNYYDSGEIAEFKRMAVVIRILVHQTSSSHSLLNQLGIENIQFLATGSKYNPNNMVPEWPLAMFEMSSRAPKFLPLLGSKPAGNRWIEFDTWWSEPVLRDTHRKILSRKELVLMVANQDGGAHVDPNIDEAYHRLAKEHSIGMAYKLDRGQVALPVEHIEKVYIRQISYEIMESIKPAWNKIMGNRGCECGSGRKARYCCLK